MVPKQIGRVACHGAHVHNGITNLLLHCGDHVLKACEALNKVIFGARREVALKHLLSVVLEELLDEELVKKACLAHCGSLAPHHEFPRSIGQLLIWIAMCINFKVGCAASIHNGRPFK